MKPISAELSDKIAYSILEKLQMRILRKDQLENQPK